MVDGLEQQDRIVVDQQPRVSDEALWSPMPLVIFSTLDLSDRRLGTRAAVVNLAVVSLLTQGGHACYYHSLAASANNTMATS